MSEEKKLNEENVEPEEEYPFLKETFKDEQITGKKIWRGIWKAAGRGLVFGLTACIVFCALKPRVEGLFEDKRESLTIPKDEEETLSEEETEVLEEPQTMTVENYREMNKAMYEVAIEAKNCVVEVRANDDGDSWKETESENPAVSGVIVWDNGTEILILAPFGELPHTGSFQVKFSNGTQYAATSKWQDENLGFGVFVVQKSLISNATLKRIQVVEWGNSRLLGKGDPVISLGMQFGYSDGMGYGVISSKNNKVIIADYQYPVLTTDITAASKGSGILFNIDGEVVGIVDQKSTDTVDANLVSAYAISDIKEVIERLSNGKGIPYLGIVGIEVTEEISEKEGVPVGIYVKEVEVNSPAMQAGIQCGDVIVGMNKTEIKNQRAYSSKLLEFSKDDTVTLHVKRLGAETYENMEFEAVVSNKKE